MYILSHVSFDYYRFENSYCISEDIGKLIDRATKVYKDLPLVVEIEDSSLVSDEYDVNERAHWLIWKIEEI